MRFVEGVAVKIKKKGIFMLPVKAVLDTTKASFAMEGMYVTENDEKTPWMSLRGNGTYEDVIDEIEQKYVITGG